MTHDFRNLNREQLRRLVILDAFFDSKPCQKLLLNVFIKRFDYNKSNISVAKKNTSI